MRKLNVDSALTDTGSNHIQAMELAFELNEEKMLSTTSNILDPLVAETG